MKQEPATTESDAQVHRQQVARNALIYVLAGVLGHLYVLGTMPMLTRALAPNEWGFYIILAQLNSILQYAAVALFSQSILKFFVEYDSDERKRFVGTVIVAVVFLQALLVSFLYLFRQDTVLVLYANLSLPLDPYFIWAVMWFWSTPVRALLYSVLKVRERVWSLLTANLLHGCALLPFIYYFVYRSEGGLVNALQSVVAAELFSLIVAALLALPGNFRPAFVLSHFKRCVVFASPLLGGTLCVLLLNNLDRFVLSRYVDLATVGYYGIGVILGGALGIVVSGAMTAITPRMVRVLWTEGEEAGGQLAGSLIRDVLLVVGVPYALLCLFGELVLPIISGSAEAASVAGPVFVGIASGHFVRSLYLPAQNTLFYKGRTWALLGNNVILLIIAAVIAPILAMAGPAALGWLLATTFFVISPFTYRLARRILPFRISVKCLAGPMFAIVFAVSITLWTFGANVSWQSATWWISRSLALSVLIVVCGKPFFRLLTNKVDKSQSAGL